MKIFFAFVVLLIGFAFQSRAQEDADVRWYENFFRPQKLKLIDKEIQQANSRRLKALDAKDKPAEVKALIELGVFHLAYVIDYEQALGWLIRSLPLKIHLTCTKRKSSLSSPWLAYLKKWATTTRVLNF